MSDLKELRARAKKLGYRVLRRRDGYFVAGTDPADDGTGFGSMDLKVVARMLDAFEGIKPFEINCDNGARFVIGQAQFEEREANKLKAKASLLHPAHGTAQ
jgi:hypothetical protein